MKYSRNSFLNVAALAAALTLSACGKQEAPPPAPAQAPPAQVPATPPPPAAVPAPPTTTVTSLVLGNALDADGKVASPATTFAPRDTIYAQVVTTSTGGSGSASIMAKWTYNMGQPVSQNTESVSTAAGTATTTFHISKPDGWPAGKYEVQISIDGKPVTNAAFEVK
jgi:hypothetical protein